MTRMRPVPYNTRRLNTFLYVVTFPYFPPKQTLFRVSPRSRRPRERRLFLAGKPITRRSSPRPLLIKKKTYFMEYRITIHKYIIKTETRSVSSSEVSRPIWRYRRMQYFRVHSNYDESAALGERPETYTLGVIDGRRDLLKRVRLHTKRRHGATYIRSGEIVYVFLNDSELIYPVALFGPDKDVRNDWSLDLRARSSRFTTGLYSTDETSWRYAIKTVRSIIRNRPMEMTTRSYSPYPVWSTTDERETPSDVAYSIGFSTLNVR